MADKVYCSKHGMQEIDEERIVEVETFRVHETDGSGRGMPTDRGAFIIHGQLTCKCRTSYVTTGTGFLVTT